MDASVWVSKHMFPTGNQACKMPLQASEKWHNSNGQRGSKSSAFPFSLLPDFNLNFWGLLWASHSIRYKIFLRESVLKLSFSNIYFPLNSSSHQLKQFTARDTCANTSGEGFSAPAVACTSPSSNTRNTKSNSQVQSRSSVAGWPWQHTRARTSKMKYIIQKKPTCKQVYR